MPATLEAAVLFVLLIAPGYFCVSAYNQFSSGSSTRFTAFHLAQAVPTSIVLLALTWWPLSGCLVKRLSNLSADVPGGVTEGSTWLLFAGLFAVAFALGAAIGKLVGWAAKDEERHPPANRASEMLRKSLRWAFDRLGFYQPATTWEEAAQLLGSANESLVKLQLSDGSVIYGPFSEGSKMSLAPRPRGMYLEKAFFENAKGDLEEAPDGAFILGDQIVGIYVLERN